jgi:phage I-like protein
MPSKLIPLRGEPKVTTAFLSAGVEPPKEFRIFAAGWNDTYKGRFLFDDEAAAEVMAANAEHGVDRPIDLEHLSVDPDAQNYDPDARGWFSLEVRNGELWAVGVTWTPDGDERIRNRKQRYISPFFGFDKKSRRVLSLYNVAICAIPATKEMPALVAASARSKLELAALSIEANEMEYKKILAALGLGDDASLEDALNAIKAFQEAKGEEKKTEEAKDEPGDDKDAEEKEEKASDDADEKELEGLTPKMRGKFLALQANMAKLSNTVTTLVKKQTKSEVETLISENTDKVPLHMEAFLKKQPIEVVQEFLKHSIATPRAKTPPKDPTGRTEEVKLTKEEKELAKLSGITEVQQLKFKQERVEKDRLRQSSHD